MGDALSEAREIKISCKIEKLRVMNAMLYPISGQD
jgi:hypothetical protein